jgi:hypothetical protein
MIQVSPPHLHNDLRPDGTPKRKWKYPILYCLDLHPGIPTSNPSLLQEYPQGPVEFTEAERIAMDEDSIAELHLLTVYLEEIGTISSETTKDENPLLYVPKKYHKYLDVFNKKLFDALPPHTEFDHEILTKEDFKPRISKIYNLSPKEQTALDEFLKENLDSGRIIPSKSPQASPLFFRPKTDYGVHPVMDYRYINTQIIRDSYPLPLISEIFDKIKNARIFSKLDVCGGYNNIRIKPGDEWKGAFITNRGLFEPTVMFFGLCNSPAAFQRMMDCLF